MELEKEIQQVKFRNEFHKAVVNIMYTGNWVQSIIASKLKPYGITPQQFNILRILKGQLPNPGTINLLIERMVDKNSNASRLVDKLETKKLVERKSCPNDRRSVHVLITDAGLEFLKRFEEGENKGLETTIGKLTEEETRTLNFLLDKYRG